MAEVPVPATTAEEEEALFGPGPAQGAGHPGGNPFEVPGLSSLPTQTTVQPTAATGSPTSAPPAQSPQVTDSGVPTFGPDAMPAFMAEMLRQQREMMAMNQQLIATMLRRMDLEEERRNKAEEKVHEAAEAAQKAAEAARTRDPFDLSTASSTVGAGSAPSAGFGGNRAEKYLPSLPLIDHLGMGKGRMKEVETWHSFMETLSSWLALQEEAFVRELQLCIPVKSEIKQVDLNVETAARSSKLFYYLTQSLAKWDRGLEFLRSCSKRQGQSACGYEVIRTITSQYSIVSRMEAVFVREQALKLYQHVSHLKRPTDLIRHLEDSFSKAEAKLSNFPELKLSEADRCSVLLQSLAAGVREYVVLHGSSSDWEALRKTLTYYEEQLRLCEAPGSSGRALQEKVCDHCGKKGHTAEKCWQRQREEKANTPKGKGKGEKGKGDQGKPKGKGRGDKTPKGGNTPRGSEKGKGDKDGKGKKNKKKKKGPTGKGRSLSEGGEPESEYPPATVMALRFAVPSASEEALPEPSAFRGRVLIPSGVPTRVVKPSCSAEIVPRPRRPEGSLECEDKGSESMGAVGSRAIARGDVAHVCKALETTAGDLWLVDSGATCHIVSNRNLSGFRVVKKYDRTANLFNASGGSLSVTGVVDLEVHFGDVFLRLEEVLVADVGFNVLSPWTGAERGWKTYLAKTGSRLYKGNKKSIKLLGAQRAWWAVSGNKKGKSKRQPRGGGGDMELDALEKCTTGAPPGLCSDLGSGPPGPRSILKGKKEGFEERGARNCLRDTPFSFMLRGFRSDLPLERDLPRTPETLEEVSGNRALRNFARKVFGMIFSMVFAMFYVMFSGMSFGMGFGMLGISLGMFFGMFFGMIFGMIRSNFGMLCSMFGSMFCSMFGNTFSNMFGWMVQEVVMIQCGVAASILEVAALRGSLFISSLAGLVCLLLLGPWAFPRVAVAASSHAINVARCVAKMPACSESSSIATIIAGLASTVGLENAGWRNTTGWGRLMFTIFLGGRFWSSRKIDLEGLSSPGRRGSVPRVELWVKSCILLGEDRQILKAFWGPLVERKRTELIGSLYQCYRGPPRKQHVTRNFPCHVGMLCMLLFGMIFGVHASAASFSGPTFVDNDGCKHGRGRVYPNFDGRGFTPGLSTKRATWTGNGARGLSCVGEPSFQPRRWFWAGCFECSAQKQSSGTSSARSFADSGCGSLSGGRRRLGSSVARGNSFEKTSFSWGCFWIRGACLWNSWECSAWEPFPSSWRVILSGATLDQSHDGGSGPPLEGSGGGRACERSSSWQRAKAIAFPLLWDPRECGRHVGFCVGGRQYSWASFAGFGKPFWIVWCSDRASWDSSPFRVWGSNASSCEGYGGLSRGSGTTSSEASHGRGCYTNNGRRNSLEPVAGQSPCWEGSCRAWAEDFGLRGKQAHSGVHASAFGGARVPIEGPEASSRPDGCIIHAESSYLSYRRAPRGYSDLLGGLEAKMLQPPANVWEKEVAQAWKILEASVVFRMVGVKKRADEKKARREGRASLRSATAKAAASGSARLPSTSASSSEEEACTLQVEVQAMNHVVGVQDGRMWKSLEDMVGYSLKEWRESSNTGLPADTEPASSEGPAAISVPPSPKSPGAESVAPSVAPGMVIADVFNLPRVPSPSVFRAYGVQAPPPVPKRSRLPTPPRAPGGGASAASSVPPTATGQTEREKSFKLPAPSPTPPSTSSPSVPAETYESLTENAFPDFQTVAAGAREAIRSGREALDEESSELE